MYISNSEKIKTNTYKCGKIVGKYLIKKGIPVLSTEDKFMVFSQTKRLQKVIDTMPLYIKILIKVGVING